MNKLLLAMMIGAALLLGGQQSDRPDQQLQSAINKEVVEGDLKGAIELYKKIAALPGAGRATVATALLRMGQCYEKLGNAEARTAYERVVRDYADQAGIVAQARIRLAALAGVRRRAGQFDVGREEGVGRGGCDWQGVARRPVPVIHRLGIGRKCRHPRPRHRREPAVDQHG